jgi:uncharacterized protein YfdQ (DUF2303 family)
MQALLAQRRQLIRLLRLSDDRVERELLWFEIIQLDAKAGLDEDRHLAEFVAEAGS